MDQLCLLKGKIHGPESRSIDCSVLTEQEAQRKPSRSCETCRTSLWEWVDPQAPALHRVSGPSLLHFVCLGECLWGGHVCPHVHVCIRIHVCPRVHVCALMCVHASMCVHAFMCVLSCEHTRSCEHSCTRVWRLMTSIDRNQEE